MNKKAKLKKTLGQGLIEAMGQAVEHSRGQLKAKERSVDLPKEIETYSKTKVVKVRKNIIKGSQPVMAAYMNVSPHTIRSWEQDKKSAKGSAALLLSLYETYPELMKALRNQMIPPDKAAAFVRKSVDKTKLESAPNQTSL